MSLIPISDEFLNLSFVLRIFKSSSGFIDFISEEIYGWCQKVRAVLLKMMLEQF